MKLQVCAVVLVITVFAEFGDATVCKPLSKFTMDCNTCRCDSTGLQYSCTDQKCEPRQDQYIREFTKEGYVLLRPRHSGRKKLLEEPDDFDFPRIRHHRVAYVNDEIGPDREENDIDDDLERSSLVTAIRKVNSNEDDDYVDDIELHDAIQK